MVAPELKLTKKVTADKEGALPRIVVERAPEVEPRRFYVLSADIESHGHTLEAAQDAQRLHRKEKRQSRITMNAERESERSLREPGHSIEVVLENTKRRSKVRFNELYPLFNCSLQCHLSKL